MPGDKKLRIRCPECRAEIVIDADTGNVIFHARAEKIPAGGATLESLMQGLEEERSRAEDVFEREKEAQKNRERLLEEKFREAFSKAEKTEDAPRPLRPFDLD